MRITELVIRVFVTILVLQVMSRLNGPKQIAQMSFYDYISGITVGSLAASTSTDQSLSLSNGLLAIILFLSCSILMGWLAEKSMWLRRFLTGKPIVLIDRGELWWKGLKKARLNMNELLSSLRYSGYFDISEVHCAILEPTGKLSVQPKGTARPPKTRELELSVPEPVRVAELVIDGAIFHENLRASGKDEQWLTQTLKSRGVSNIREVALAALDSKGKLSVYKKNIDKRSKQTGR